ncbi:MAG: hypothetical protein Q8M97_08775 [Methanobacteriaceae archaeon]|nr:hypothetical protein [Methanobacteriaceae archaeon]
MERSFLNRKALLAVFTMFVFVFAIQMAEPSSAATTKLFDKGSKISYSSTYGTYKYSWKSYKKGSNYIVVKDNVYW